MVSQKGYSILRILGAIMSHTASLEIKYYPVSIPPLSILSLLIENGWIMDDYGYITFLPNNDSDDFNWQKEGSDQYDYVFNVLRNKEIGKETIGIVLTWKDTNIGGEFLFYHDGTIQINLNINRQISEIFNKFSDINWYLNRLIPIFEGSCKIESINWNEHI